MSKIRFRPLSAIDRRLVAANRRRNGRSRNPEIGAGPVAFSLAVVGGGPSAAGFVDELREWRGEIWAINGAWRWLVGQGISATFYTIDPSPEIVEMARGAEKAVLGDTVDPRVFDVVAWPLMARFGRNGIPHACTTAASAPMIAATAGYGHVTFFGCESSYAGQTHLYENKDVPLMRVRCGEDEYLTSPAMVMQAEFLAEMARELPGYLAVRGDGFLPALIRHGDYDVTHISKRIMEGINGIRAPGISETGHGPAGPLG